MPNLRDETIARLANQKQEPGQTVEGVEKTAKEMSVVQGAMNTARELSGTSALEGQLTEANKRAEKAAEAARQAEEDKHKAEIEKVEATLGAKIDGLAKSYAGGASQQTIADQIAEIKKAAAELGMGGSKVSELKDMMNLITSLNPQKTLMDQIKDAKDLITAISPPADKQSDGLIGGMPASIALELKKMDTNLQVTLQKMQDERQARQQEFELRMKQYDLDRADRIAEAQGKIRVENDRNKMFAGGLETIGRAIGKGMQEGSRQPGGSPGAIAGQSKAGPKLYQMEAFENETGEFDCPNCQTRVAVGPTTTEAQCVECESKFTITRKAAPAASEPIPPGEE